MSEPRGRAGAGGRRAGPASPPPREGQGQALPHCAHRAGTPGLELPHLPSGAWKQGWGGRRRNSERPGLGRVRAAGVPVLGVLAAPPPCWWLSQRAVGCRPSVSHRHGSAAVASGPCLRPRSPVPLPPPPEPTSLRPVPAEGKGRGRRRFRGPWCCTGRRQGPGERGCTCVRPGCGDKAGTWRGGDRVGDA